MVDSPSSPSVAPESLIVAAAGICAAVSEWQDLRGSDPMTPDEKELLWQRDRLVGALQNYETTKRPEGER